MKYSLILLFANLASICCVIGAVYLASIGAGGWGWFLFVAVLLASTIKSDNN